MPTVEFTREDILRGKTLEPGWYPMEIKSVVEEVAKSGTSTNWVVELTVTGPTPNLIGMPLKVWFNEGAKGRMIPFVNACGAEVTEKTLEAGQSKRVDIEKCVGKKVQGFVKNGTYEGRSTNQIEDWRRI